MTLHTTLVVWSVKSGGNDPKELNDISNLMPSCRTCNHYKRAKSIEQFRRDIETIPKKLGERQYIYKVGMAYGFYDSTPRKVEFYFEKQEKESVDRG